MTIDTPIPSAPEIDAPNTVEMSDAPINSNPFSISYPVIEKVQSEPIPLKFVPINAPFDLKNPPYKLAPKVKQLMEMGFGSDPVLIQTVLEKNRDDMIATIQDLLALNEY